MAAGMLGVGGRRDRSAPRARLRPDRGAAAAATSRSSCGMRRRCSTRTSGAASATSPPPASSTSRSPPPTPDGTFAPVLAEEMPEPQERRPRQGRPVGHLAAQEERGLARRRALHRGRRDLQLGVRHRSRHRHQHAAPASTRWPASRRSTAYTVKVVYKKPQPFWAGGVHRRRADPPPRLRAPQGRAARATRWAWSSRWAPAPTSWSSSSRAT